uniref:Twinkle protein n=2 Tax=Hirondellea gigas TaxID=1518452 RepID=A0A6A7G2X4_9CRUS
MTRMTTSVKQLRRLLSNRCTPSKVFFQQRRAISLTAPGFQIPQASSSVSRPSPASSDVFVSSHFSLLENEVSEFLSDRKLEFQDKDDKVVLKYCPSCPPHKDSFTNLFKLYVWKKTGSSYCHRCGSKGSWFDFKTSFGTQPEIQSSFGRSLKKNAKGPSPRPSQKVCDQARKDLLANKHGALDLLTESRGLSKETLDKYRVGVMTQKFANNDRKYVDHLSVVFPWVHIEETGPVVDRIKIRSLSDKSHQRILPSGGSWGLFGFHTVPASATSIVLTEGEYDAMAVHQATGRPAVSLPIGCNSLPPAVLPCLEKFEKIYLWMDDDIAGQEGAEKFAQKLGYNRCYIVHSNNSSHDSSRTMKIKDANDALSAGIDLENLIRAATLFPHKKIATFQDLRTEILREFENPNETRGTQYMTLPTLNSILKGHRCGELSIWTGPTGCGKTTILSQLSLDLCQQGVNTLWGSFEIKTTRLAKMMIAQYCGKNLEDCADEFSFYADKFEELPMYFLRFFGTSKIDSVLDAMEYACYVYDVKHVILDNLQFMLGTAHGYQKFDMQDQAIEKFRRFATRKNIHITLVIHPRKESDDAPLGLASVFGGAKATQEADNVVIIQTQTGSNDGDASVRSIEVKKNRFSGDLGTIPFTFDSDSRSIRELSDSELDKFGIYDAYHRTVSNFQPPELDQPMTEETPQELEDIFSKQTNVENMYTVSAGEKLRINGINGSSFVNGIGGINGIDHSASGLAQYSLSIRPITNRPQKLQTSFPGIITG